MSALGQNQTFRSAIGMSALPPKADMCGALAHVRLVPIADIAPFTRSPHRRGRARRWEGEAERLGGLEVDD